MRKLLVHVEHELPSRIGDGKENRHRRKGRMMSTISSALNYSAPLKQKGTGENWVIDGITRSPELLYNFDIVPIEVLITDLYDHTEQPSLDYSGFERLDAPTDVDQCALMDGDRSSLNRYRRELEMLLRIRTGADSVVFFDATVRCENSDRERPPGVAAAHLRVHVDQNPRSARTRAMNHGGKGRQYRRFQIVNAWRPLLHPVRNYPLALCDFRSLEPITDLVPTQLRFPPWLKDKENYSVKFHPRHRWFYWRSLSPDDLVLFKCHDSASLKLAQSIGEREDGSHENIAGLCPHTSFIDPTAETTGSLRASLEMRTLLFFD